MPAREIKSLEVKVVMRPVERGGQGEAGAVFNCGADVGEAKKRNIVRKMLVGGLSISFFRYGLFFFCFLCYYVLILYLNKERYSGA